MSSPQNIPDIFIDGLRYRSSTLTTTQATDPEDIEEQCEGLDDLLRHSHVKLADDNMFFWPDELLIRLVNEERVMEDLHMFGGFGMRDIDDFTSKIIIQPTANPATNALERKYLKIFSILVLMGEIPKIETFIRLGIGDSALPLVKCGKDLALQTSPHVALGCSKGWNNAKLDLWERYQWLFLVPFFEMGPENNVKHTRFDDKVILPWYEVGEEIDGGFAKVTKVKMDRSCHSFHSVLQTISMEDNSFALKELRTRNWEEFQKEVLMLKRFSGLVHDHLVTLLTTFTWKQHYYLLFPWASCDMDQYMNIEPLPIVDDVEAMRWLSGQILGITRAIRVIHDAPHLHDAASPLYDPKFGRHGDLKPDNVLWFRSETPEYKKRGIFVISDFGLGAFHRDTSRSNVPNKNIPGAPGYRPPECDMEGGTISRAFDVWTLGCLLLELVTWALGGSDLREEFSIGRESTYIHGSRTNTFYSVKMDEKTGGYVFAVKDEVIQWYTTLHAHEKCTQFTHDVLDVIREDMITVLSEKRPTRTRSPVLVRKIEAIHKRATDEENPGYITDFCPASRVIVPDKPVRADLNSRARGEIKTNKPRLEKLQGQSQAGLSAHRLSQQL